MYLHPFVKYVLNAYFIKHVDIINIITCAQGELDRRFMVVGREAGMAGGRRSHKK